MALIAGKIIIIYNWFIILLYVAIFKGHHFRMVYTRRHGLHLVGVYSVWGCFFADYFSNMQSGEMLNQNTVIYGHSGNDEKPNGNRFGQLYRYVDKEFLQENPYIYLTIGEEQLTFEVFGVFYTDTSFYYIAPTPSEQGFDVFMETVNRNNLHNLEIEVTEQDKLLTLSTCSVRYDANETGNHRFVVMAKLV